MKEWRRILKENRRLMSSSATEKKYIGDESLLQTRQRSCYAISLVCQLLMMGACSVIEGAV